MECAVQEIYAKPAAQEVLDVPAGQDTIVLIIVQVRLDMSKAACSGSALDGPWHGRGKEVRARPIIASQL